MIQKIFLIRNIIIGFTGIFLGLIIGGIFSRILTVTDFIQIESDVYIINQLIVKNNPLDFLSIIVVSGIIVLVSAYIPLKKIKK